MCHLEERAWIAQSQLNVIPEKEGWGSSSLATCVTRKGRLVALAQLHMLPGRECGGGPTSATCVTWKGGLE